MRTGKTPQSNIAQLALMAEADAMEAPQADAVSDMIFSADGYQHWQAASGAIHIERLIWHRTDHLAEDLECADYLTQYGHDGEKLLTDHIKKVSKESQWDACFIREDGPIATQCRRLLGATEEEFIAASKALARRLYESMTGNRFRSRITRGDFVAAIYRHDGEELRRIAIFKLDMETRQVRSRDHEGEKTRFNITANDGVLPTSNSNNFTKCALLTPEDTTDEDGTMTNRFHIRLLDAQAGPLSHGVAVFFYEGFMDATLVPNAKRHTREFLRVTGEFISQQEDTVTSEDRERFYEARRETLSAALLNNDDPQVNIDQFVEAALPNHPDLQDQLASNLARNILPTSTPSESSAHCFSIDAGVARPFVHKVTLEVDRGVRLVFPSLDAYKDMVTIEKDDHENLYRIVIETRTYRQLGH
jgi:nucleoid associated protein NdpA